MNVFNNPLQDAASKMNLDEWNENKLPPCSLYGKYLQIASHKFRLPIDECRSKYGLYTIAEWIKLLSS